MKGKELGIAITALLLAHPRFIAKNKAAYAAFFHHTTTGKVIAVSPTKTSFTNLWVESSVVPPGTIAGVKDKAYFASNYAVSKPNHDLFGKDGFDEVDLTNFKVEDVWQAVRVLVQTGGI